jgi:hypothetical protein
MFGYLKKLALSVVPSVSTQHQNIFDGEAEIVWSGLIQ